MSSESFRPRTRMHTAEHILSAVMRLDYGAERNLELHLGDKKTKCDYAPARQLSPPDLSIIEGRVNEEIARDHIVRESALQRADANQFDLWKVPPDAESIRIVHIGDLDAQPCSGEHVDHTQQIGSFRLISHEYRANGRLRIRFKVGPA